jgi:hypothetical protein
MTTKHSTYDIDVLSLLDIHDVALSLVLEDHAVWVLGVVRVASLGGGEGNARGAIHAQSESIDCSPIDEGLKKRQIGSDWQASKDDLADFGSCDGLVHRQAGVGSTRKTYEQCRVLEACPKKSSEWPSLEQLGPRYQ